MLLFVSLLLLVKTKRARGDSAKEAPKTVTMQGRQDGRRNNKCVFPADVKGALAALGTAAMGLALVGPMVSLPEVAAAADKRTIGEISASGLFFKVRLSSLLASRACFLFHY